MSKLIKAFRERVAKSKDLALKSEAECDVAYSTGFLGLDYLNGVNIKVSGNNKYFSYDSCGLTCGSTNCIIGRSGSGKSTLAVQISTNIIRPFKDSCMFYDDLESGCPAPRLKNLSKFSDEELNERVIYRNTGITVENFYERIKMIYDLKTQKERESYEYDTGLYDYKGNRIFKLEPTVYLVDSIPLLMPKDINDEDTLSGNMHGASIAKSNTFVFRKIAQLCKEANIILISINHILDNISINPFDHKKAQLPFLKQTERLPGSAAAIYLANNMIRVDDGAKLKPEEAYGIYGSIVHLQLVKSRTNKSGRSIPMIFDQDNGFDPDLSLFEMLKEYGAINGAGSFLYIGDRSDIKFSQRKFKETLYSNADLQKVFADTCYEVLKTLLAPVDELGYMEEEDVAQFNISAAIMNKSRAGIPDYKEIELKEVPTKTEESNKDSDEEDSNVVGIDTIKDVSKMSKAKKKAKEESVEEMLLA